MEKTKITYSSPEHSRLKNVLIQVIEYMTGRARLEKRYQEIIREKGGSKNIWELFTDKLELTPVFDKNQINKVPKEGPLVFIANHPYGVVDGVLFGLLVSKMRPKFKFLVHEVLCKDKDLNEFFLPISFDESKEAIRRNIESKKIALNEISQGNPVVIFPGGGVATAPRFWMKAQELEWKKFVAKLISQSKATVIPIYFPGQNSRLFQIVSNMSMDFRISMLLNEVRNKIGKTIKVEIGEPIAFDDLPITKDKQALLEFLSEKVLSLNPNLSYQDK